MKCAASLVVIVLVTVVASGLTHRGPSAPGLRDLSGLPRAHAQTGGSYDLTWSTMDGGGYIFSTGVGYSLGGTLGQPDAGAWSGGGYTLAGGLWSGGASQYRIYLPLVLRGT